LLSISFFTYPLPHHSLHSFPTRRSSDLLARQLPFLKQAIQQQPVVDPNAKALETDGAEQIVDDEDDFNVSADIEIVLVINDLLRAIGFERFRIRVNNRLLLNGLLEEWKLAGQSRPLLAALHKLEKAGRDALVKEMVDKAGVSSVQAERLVTLTQIQ